MPPARAQALSARWRVIRSDEGGEPGAKNFAALVQRFRPALTRPIYATECP